MKKFLLFFLLATNGLQAYDCFQEYIEDCCQETYVTLGGGAVFPMRNSSVTGDSNGVLFFPTIPGTSLFTLTDVKWKNKFKAGYEVNAAAGCKLCSNWRIEEEFLYQNLQRNISGSYTWNEFDAATGNIFANANEPIRHATTRTNIYTLLTNFNYDHRTCSCWILSIGGGVGVAWLQSKSTSKADTLVVNLPTHVPPIVESSQTLEKSPKLYGTAFAWQVKVGVGYEFLENFSAEVNYRLFGTTRFQARSSSITTNPDTAVSTVFTMPPDEIRGMLNSSVNLSLNLSF